MTSATLSDLHQQAETEKQLFEKAYAAEAHTDFNWDSPNGKLLSYLFSHSHLLVHYLIQHPLLSDRLNFSFPAFGSKEAKSQSSALSLELNLKLKTDDQPLSLEKFMSLLRHFKYEHLVALAAADFSRTVPSENILLKWSSVCDVILEACYNYTLHTLLTEKNVASLKEANLPPASIIALGKLGAVELNMSSDIDLICIYKHDTKDTSPSASEFYSQLVRKITHCLSEKTDDGFVFRVDHDLRPEGGKGPLANSLDTILRYYEERGQQWERQALIRARCVAGSHALAETFFESLEPFIYPRTITFDQLKNIQAMKRKIEEKTREAHQNIKLGKGGIRDVEFFIQAQQLLYGGKNKKLRTHNTFQAIERLKNENILHPKIAEKVKSAYSFFRTFENALQLNFDQQTHHIPNDSSELSRICSALQFSSVTELNDTLLKHRLFISNCFDSLFNDDFEQHEIEEALKVNLASCENEEEQTDSLAWFKKHEVGRIQSLDLSKNISRSKVELRLTQLARALVTTVHDLCFQQLQEKYGTPCDESGNVVSFSILGFGKLGSGEMCYGSDLDVAFIYGEKGKTSGQHSVSNKNFFTKLAQRIISTLSLPTRYGKTYDVDADLRPSGKSGALVISLEAFREYHKKQTEIWEKMMLLKNTPLTGDKKLQENIQEVIQSVLFESDEEKTTLKEKINTYQTQFQSQFGKESDDFIHLKHGSGGISTIELLIRYLQLRSLQQYPELLERNSLRLIAKLGEFELITKEEMLILETALEHYNTTISLLRLSSETTSDVLYKKSNITPDIARYLELKNTEALFLELQTCKEKVLQVFKKYFEEND